MLSDFNPEIQKTLKQHFENIGKFDHVELLEVEPGHAKASIEILKDALNVYGNVHGGFLFSFADAVAAAAAYAYGFSNVTQNATIHYLRGINSGTLYAESNVVHKGKSTAVVQVDLSDDRERLIATAVFTMFFKQPV